MPSSPQVLVVGAGPSGLVLALALLRNGISVRIIDKNPDPRLGQRGAGIMPRSLELFHILGVGRQVLEQARVMPMVKMYELYGGLDALKTFEMSPSAQPTAGTPYLNIVILGQDSLERILQDEIANEYNCVIETGTELVSIHQQPDRVNVNILKNGLTEELSYPWVIGTDGARGIVRKQLGATFFGETPNVDNIVVGDIKVEGLDRNFWHMWGDSASTLISLRATEKPSLFSFIISGQEIDQHTLSTDIDALRRLFIEKTGTDSVTFGELTWISTYRPNIRMVDKLGEGRVYLAGDSAHIHSFTGGQGVNTGMQDSFNLAWKLALVERGLSPVSLLTTYAEERLPVVSEMLNQTTALLNREFKGEERPSSWSRSANLLQLGVNYRWSSIVVDEQCDLDDFDDDLLDEPVDSYGIAHSGDLRAGDRAPDAPGLIDRKSPPPLTVSTRLFDIFGPSYHTLLLFSSDPNVCTALLRVIRKHPSGSIRMALVISSGETPPFNAEEADFVLEDQSGHAYDAYMAGGCKCTIVRPDGIVGASVRGPEGARQYFRGIFSP